MTWKHYLGPVLALALAAPLQADAQSGEPQPAPQPKPQMEQPEQQNRPAMQRREAQTQQNVIRADRLIGQTIRDRQNDRAGRIDDLALDLQEGRIAYAVVTRGGVWGIGGEDVALQWKQIEPDPAARAVRVDREHLQQARQIDTGKTWPAGIPGEQAVGTAGAGAQHVVPMSNVIGMDVENKQGERLGRIDDVAIRPDGSVSYAVIAHGGFLGMGDEYIAVPWNRLNLEAQRQNAVLDVTEEQLRQAKSFEHREQWPARVDWPFAGPR